MGRNVNCVHFCKGNQCRKHSEGKWFSRLCVRLEDRECLDKVEVPRPLILPVGHRPKPINCATCTAGKRAAEDKNF